MQPDPPGERGCEEHLLCGRRKKKIKLSAATTFLSPTTCKHHPDTNAAVTQLLHGYPCQITIPPGPGIRLSKHCICAPRRGTYRRRQTLCWAPTRDRGCGHTHLSQVVEVILVVHPLVVGGHAVGPVGDVPDVDSKAVVELALEELQDGSDPISPFPHRVPHAPWDVQKLPRWWVECRAASQVEHDR